MNSETDSEIENIFLNNANISEALSPTLATPLSPILYSSRRRLFHKKIPSRKSRVKLTKRFQEDTKEEIPTFNEESFSYTDSEDLIKAFDRLEQIQKNRETAYKVLLKNKKSDFPFKKPISPAPKQLGFQTVPVKSEEIKPEPHPTKTIQDSGEKISVIQQCPIKLPKNLNFQTATGKSISISQENIEKHSNLFGDIISSRQVESSRKNKYNYLKKITSVEDISVLQPDLNPENQTSFTQEICDSGISNTQILCAADKVLTPIKSSSSDIEGFVGFNKGEISESIMLGSKFISKSKQKWENNFFNNGKHKLDGLESPSSKKLKLNNFLDDSNGQYFDPYESSSKNTIQKNFQNEIDFPPVKKCTTETTNVNVDEGFKTFGQKLVRFNSLIESKTVLGNNNITGCDEKVPKTVISSNLGAFSTASGQTLTMTSKSLSKAKDIFENMDIDIELPMQDNKHLHQKEMLRNGINENKSFESVTSALNFGGFSSASGKKITIDTESLNRCKDIFDNIDLNIDIQNVKLNSTASKEIIPPENDKQKSNLDTKNFKEPICSGFASASGQKLSVTTTSLIKAKNIFENLDLDIPNVKSTIYDTEKYFESVICTSNGFSSNGKMPLKINSNADTGLNEISSSLDKNVLESHCIKDIGKNTGTFSNNVVSEKITDCNKFSNNHVLVKNKLKYFDELIGDDCDFVPKTNLLSTTVKAVNKIDVNSKPSKIVKGKLDFFDKLLGKNDDFQSDQTSQNFGKFSMASGKMLKTSTSGTTKSSGIFDDILHKNPLNFSTPVKNLNTSANSIKKSTKKLGISGCKQISLPESKLQKAKLMFDEDFSGISPIKPLAQNTEYPQTFNFCSTPLRNNSHINSEGNETTETKQTFIEQKEDILKLRDDFVVTFANAVEKTVVDFDVDYQEEVRKIEERLMIIKMRQKGIERLREEKPDCDKKPKEGVLYRSKTKKDRKSLKNFVNGEKLGKHSEESLFCINAKNATDIHFKESSTTVLTKDEAVVIPNIKDLIGLNEIKLAFEAMPGVDPKLIPKGWIKNHFKWIIWKLASYERMFSNMFKGALSIEQVMQQLKYRYDREIDKVERSAIRKILEKDDAPQKRMVLCVSDIKKLNLNNFELELTDGWYSIRSVIDEPLCHQILTGKLQIGTKLVICGAELMNCDGCHPLDVTDLTYLKINFNCTRRAKWDTRLGYQKFPGPFSLSTHTIHPYGGIISAIKICIARVYPLKYLDKTENISVWRNQKAEERKAQEWENDRYKSLEKMEEDIRKEFCSRNNKENKNGDSRNNNVNISSVTCPKTLMEIIEWSNDPDSLEMLLSSTQRTALLDYKRNLFLQKQQEVAAKVKSSAEKLKMAKREVTPIMKLLVVDLNGSPTKGFNFFLWRPSESHVYMLREEKCLTVYNVLPKANGDLYSVSKTMFKENSSTDHMSVIFKRKLVLIEELNDLKFSRNFCDFDTVGIIVETVTKSNSQEIWLCDTSGRLLVIKVFESPTNCLLVDNLKRGQATSVCNLIYRGLKDDICIACANHFTVFSQYPRYNYLQNGLDEIKKGLTKDFSKILEGCDARIEKFRGKTSSKDFSVTYEENEEDTLVPSRITSSDIAMSLIDFDKFI